MYFLTFIHPEEFNDEKAAEGLVKIMEKGVSTKATANKAVRGHQKIKFRWKDLILNSLRRSLKQYNL